MHFSAALLASSGLVSLVHAQYSLQDDYSGSNFFNLMTFDTENDPTHGYVNYVDQATAQSDGLVGVSNGVVTIKSDSTNVASGRGRNSVRVTSTKEYTHALVVLDLEHMPGSACGIWPAFWMTGPSWPNNGEIDIIEGVSYQTQNAMTMHTSSGCSMVQESCEGNQGCGVQTGGANSFGDGFNNANGGVYAMEWTSSAINIWFFSRSNVPAGISGSSPDPSTWGNPTASFQGGSACSIDEHFNNNNIVFDTTFCGDWAGSVWSQDPTCSAKAATCQDYVQNNPSAFSSAYWAINSLKVYTVNGGSPVAAIANTLPSSAQAAAPAITSTSAPAVAAGQTSSPTAPVAASSSPPAAIIASSPPSASPSPPASQSSPSAASVSSSPLSETTVPVANKNGGSAFQGVPAGEAVGIGSATPGGPLTENPIDSKRSLADLLGTSPTDARKQKRAPRAMRHLRRHHKLGVHA